MAPLHLVERLWPSNLPISALELDRRFPSTSLSTSEYSATLSPLEANAYLQIRTPAPPESKTPHGKGAFDPHDINNRGIFALFALLAAGLVLTSIWFFFWAKNGGFHFREGDWEEYKSTVLRRKGPNGTTLSNATKSTELGGGSVVASEQQKEEGDAESFFLRKGKRHRKGHKPRGNKNNDDNDVRAYRHEKPARVGGLNKEPDGSYQSDYAYTATAPSEFSQPTSIPTAPSEYSEPVPIPPSEYSEVPPIPPYEYSEAPTAPSEYLSKPPAAKKRSHHLFSKTPKTPTKKQKAPANIETPSSTSSHRPLRMDSTASTPTRSSPRRHTPYRHSHHPHSTAAGGSNRYGGPATNSASTAYTEPLDFDSRYATSEAAGTEMTEDKGTKTYFHPIPRLTAAPAGFRRGGGRRRDSLSDSEGDETVRS